jgi:hypothetical protein
MEQLSHMSTPKPADSSRITLVPVTDPALLDPANWYSGEKLSDIIAGYEKRQEEAQKAAHAEWSEPQK